jgi:hypothetical protein
LKTEGTKRWSQNTTELKTEGTKRWSQNTTELKTKKEEETKRWSQNTTELKTKHCATWTPLKPVVNTDAPKRFLLRYYCIFTISLWKIFDTCSVYSQISWKWLVEIRNILLQRCL